MDDPGLLLVRSSVTQFIGKAIDYFARDVKFQPIVVIEFDAAIEKRMKQLQLQQQQGASAQSYDSDTDIEPCESNEECENTPHSPLEPIVRTLEKINTPKKANRTRKSVLQSKNTSPVSQAVKATRQQIMARYDQLRRRESRRHGAIKQKQEMMQKIDELKLKMDNKMKEIIKEAKKRHKEDMDIFKEELSRGAHPELMEIEGNHQRKASELKEHLRHQTYCRSCLWVRAYEDSTCPCNEAFYCSKTCQDNDYLNHRPKCPVAIKFFGPMHPFEEILAGSRIGIK